MLENHQRTGKQKPKEQHPRRFSTPEEAIYPVGCRLHLSLIISFRIVYKSIPTAPTTAAANPASGTYLPAAPFEFVAAGLGPVDVADAVLDAAAELVGAAPAPALTVEESRLPQLLLHWEEPGYCLLHRAKVYWHSRKGRVCLYWGRLEGV